MTDPATIEGPDYVACALPGYAVDRVYRWTRNHKKPLPDMQVTESGPDNVVEVLVRLYESAKVYTLLIVLPGSKAKTGWAVVSELASGEPDLMGKLEDLEEGIAALYERVRVDVAGEGR